MCGQVSARLNLSPGLTSPTMSSHAAVSVLLRDLHSRLSRHLLQPTEGGRFLAIVITGRGNVQSDHLHIIGSHPEDLGTKVMLVVRQQSIQSDMLPSQLASVCSLCFTGGVSGSRHDRIVRISPRALFCDGDIVVAFVLQDTQPPAQNAPARCARKHKPP